jgi:hypothetical protein
VRTNATGFASCSCSGTIGDFVWNDLNLNGIQDAGEPGLAGVGVILKDGASQVIGTTTTNARAFYQFTGRCAGTYTVEVNASTLPAGFVASPCNAGPDRCEGQQLLSGEYDALEQRGERPHPGLRLSRPAVHDERELHGQQRVQRRRNVLGRHLSAWGSL